MAVDKTRRATATVEVRVGLLPPDQPDDEPAATPRVWARVSLPPEAFADNFPRCWFLCSERSEAVVKRQIRECGGPPVWMQADAWKWEARRIRIEMATLEGILWRLSQGLEP